MASGGRSSSAFVPSARRSGPMTTLHRFDASTSGSDVFSRHVGQIGKQDQHRRRLGSHCAMPNAAQRLVQVRWPFFPHRLSPELGGKLQHGLIAADDDDVLEAVAVDQRSQRVTHQRSRELMALGQREHAFEAALCHVEGLHRHHRPTAPVVRTRRHQLFFPKNCVVNTLETSAGFSMILKSSSAAASACHCSRVCQP